MYKYNTYKLKNGIKFITINNKKTKLITLNISLKIGNDSETKKMLLEITHFLEHMFCLFTSHKYPNGKINRETMSNKNIELDASVIDKLLNFTLEFKPKHSDYVADLICNALLNYKPDDGIFKQEQNAVIEELNNIIKDSDYKFETKINSIMFKGHQRSHSIRERLENCKRITTGQIYDFYKSHFVSGNIVVGVFGNYKNDFILYLKKNLCKIHHGEIVYIPMKSYHNQKIIYYHKSSNISNLKIFFNIPYLCFDNINYQINAITDILSDDLNSLLLKKLRTEYGLIYSLSMYTDCDEIDNKLSYITIETLCDTSNLIKVIKSIFETLIDTKNIPINNIYINKYKEQVDISYSKEKFSPEPEDILESYIHYMLWGEKIVSFENEYKNNKKISSESLKKTANKIFDFSNMTVCYDGQKNLNGMIDEMLKCL